MPQFQLRQSNALTRRNSVSKPYSSQAVDNLPMFSPSSGHVNSSCCCWGISRRYNRTASFGKWNCCDHHKPQPRGNLTISAVSVSLIPKHGYSCWGATTRWRNFEKGSYACPYKCRKHRLREGQPWFHPFQFPFVNVANARVKSTRKYSITLFASCFEQERRRHLVEFGHHRCVWVCFAKYFKRSHWSPPFP